MVFVDLRRCVVGVLVALVCLPLTGSAVAAVTPLQPYHWGTYGVHTLIDEGEIGSYRGAACHYNGSLYLDSIRIRRPISFAAAGQPQYIGWRYQIDGTNDANLFTATWSKVYLSPIEKVWTTKDQPAPFLPKIYHLGTLTYASYRVVDKMLWYRPVSHVAGKAFIAVETYDDPAPPAAFEEACPAVHAITNRAAAVGPDQPYLWGTYGVQILIDDSDSYRGTACFYNGGSLDRMRIRRPIAFSTGGPQYLAWRYEIDGTNETVDLYTATWTKVDEGPLEKVWTSRMQPAPFLPKLHQFNAIGAYAYYRVVAKMFWYRPSGHVNGKAFLMVDSYDDGSIGSIDYFDYGCPATHP